MRILLWCWAICLIFITVTTSFNKSDIAFDKVRKDYKHDANHTRIDRGIWRIIQRAGEILSIIKRTRWSNHCIIIRCWDPIYVEMNCWNVNSWKELFLMTVTTLPLSLVETKSSTRCRTPTNTRWVYCCTNRNIFTYNCTNAIAWETEKLYRKNTKSAYRWHLSKTHTPT